MTKSACDVGLNKEGKKACRTCAMSMLVSWYMDELRDKGFKDQAALVEKAALDESGSPEDVCKVMEQVSTTVDAPMQARLLELNEVFDSHAVQMEDEDD
jgi:hypothetical protein